MTKTFLHTAAKSLVLAGLSASALMMGGQEAGAGACVEFFDTKGLKGVALGSTLTAGTYTILGDSACTGASATIASGVTIYDQLGATGTITLNTGAALTWNAATGKTSTLTLTKGTATTSTATISGSVTFGADPDVSTTITTVGAGTLTGAAAGGWTYPLVLTATSDTTLATYTSMTGKLKTVAGAKFTPGNSFKITYN